MVSARVVTPAQLAEALRELEDGKTWTRELRRGYRRVGTVAAGWARAEMRGHESRQVQRAARAVRGSSTSTSARINVGGRAVPGALAATWGTKGPSGWYAGWRNGEMDERRRFGYSAAARARSNNPPWVGNTWRVATKGEGPRGINDALADNTDKLLDLFAEEAETVLGKALGGRAKAGL